MNWYEIFAIIILIIFSTGIFALTIYNKIKGKSSCAKECSGSCGTCGHTCNCSKNLLEEYRKENSSK